MDGDIGQAFEWLRKRGIAKASAMADRSANEGDVCRVHSAAGVSWEGRRGGGLRQLEWIERNYTLFQDTLTVLHYIVLYVKPPSRLGVGKNNSTPLPSGTNLSRLRCLQYNRAM